MIKNELFNVLNNITIKVFGVLAAFYFTFIVASRADDDVSGEFFFYVNVITFFSALLRFGTDTYLIKFISSVGEKYKSIRSAQVSSVFVIITLLEVLLSVPLFIFFYKSGSNLLDAFLVVFSIYLQSVYVVFCNILFGVGRSSLASFLINAYIYISFIVVFYLHQDSTLTFLLVYYVGALLTSLFISASLVFRIIPFVIVFKCKHLNLLMSKLVPYFMFSLFDQLNKWYPLIFCKFFVLNSIYSVITVSHRYSLFVSMIAIVSAPIFSRRVSKAKSKLSDAEVFSLICKLVLSILIASLIVFVFTSFFSEIILNFINTEFTSHSNIFVIFGLVGVTYSCYFFSYNLMMMLDMQDYVRKIVFYSFIISNVVSMPVLAISPEYFAPVFIAVGSVFSTVMMFLSYRRRL